MKHRFSSAKSDGADSTLVQPSNWNAVHDVGVTAISANTTLDGTYDTVLATAGAGGITVTLPAVASSANRIYRIMKVDNAAGTVTIDANASETINGDLTYTLVNQYDVIEIACNGSAWYVTDVRTGFSIASVQVLTSGTTYTPSAGTKAIVVECIGGGGGGGGAAGATSSAGAASGGGAGGYCKKLIVFPAASYTIAIGGAGTGGAAGNNNGTAGGNTTFGTSLLTANGGALGTGSGAAGTTVVEVAGGAGGTATGGDINITGSGGSSGVRFSGTQSFSGYGGNSVLGMGGTEVMNAAGKAGTNYGAGGGGASTQGATNRAGGNGAAGVIIVTEYK